jgi:GTP-binding protein
VIADIPGLIEGASEGKGLGYQFLRHIENCSILLYVLSIDESVVQDENITPKQKTEDLWHQYLTLQKELKDYKQSVSEKPSHIVINKIDLFPEGLAKEISAYFKKKKMPAMLISAATGEGMDAVDELLAQFT